MKPHVVIRLGTRSSPLALAQAAAVAEGLRRLSAEVEIVPMKTEGDRLFGARLAEVGGKGLFVRELEEALAEGAIDAAVHSLKDLPAEQPTASRWPPSRSGRTRATSSSRRAAGAWRICRRRRSSAPPVCGGGPSRWRSAPTWWWSRSAETSTRGCAS